MQLLSYVSPRYLPSGRTVAEVTGAHPGSLYRLLRALAHIGIFTELDGACFANSELSDILRPGVPGSLYEVATVGTDVMRQTWDELLYSVRTGESGFTKIHGMPAWQYSVEGDPAAGARGNQGMANFSAAMDAAVAQAADLSGVRFVVDIGGGYGGLLTALLATYPSIEKSILFDQPRVIDEASTVLNPGSDERIELTAGEFFTAVPSGADVYMM